MKPFNTVKNHSEIVRNHIRKRLNTAVFEETMNLAPIGALCIFGSQYIMGRAFSSVT